MNKSNKIEYLDIDIPTNLDFDSIAIKKFSKVQQAIFSLSYLGLKNCQISPFLQSFIYKTYCLSQFTYGLGTITLNSKTKEYLNIAQNNLLRQMIGLKSRCQMSNILKCLKIFNFEQLYLQSKLSFIESLKYNYLASEIFNDLSISPRIKGSKLKSFDQDITILEDFFNSNITNIGTQTGELKKLLKLQFSIKDGLTDSINLCLSNKNDKKYYFLLVELTKSFEIE